MKYLCFLLLTGASFTACKKEDKTTAAVTSKLPVSFTGMKTWRSSHRYLVGRNPYRDTTVAGIENFDVTTIGIDTIVIHSDRLYYESSDTTSSGYRLNYKGSDFRMGYSHMSATFVHNTSGDTIFYSSSFQSFGNSNNDSYVTP